MRAPGFIRLRGTFKQRHRGDRPATRPSCSELLGSNHALARCIDTLDEIIDAAMVVTAVLVGSVIEFWNGIEAAAWLVGAAVVVLFGVALMAAAVEQRKRVAALGLVAAGHESLPIAAVQRQRLKLLAPQTRVALARWVEDVLREASCPRPPARGVRPLYDARVVRAAASELRELIDQLRTGRPAAAALARTQLLLTDGRSSLYGHEPEPLREDLRRITRYPIA
jgi:hypothetical protein